MHSIFDIGGDFMQDYRFSFERRRKPDKVIKLITITSVMGWIMVILCTLLTIYAKPEQTNLFYELFNIRIRNYWDYSLLNVVFLLLACLLLLSLVGIIMNAMRCRRKTDRINKSLVFQAFLSLGGIILLLLNLK